MEGEEHKLTIIRRKGALFVATVLMLVLGITSAAWACTVFVGSMTLKGNASTSSITFYGNGTSMGHKCKAGTGTSANSPGSVTVTVRGTNTTNCGASKLPSSYTYGVTFISDGFNGDIYDTSRDCMWNGGHSQSIILYNSSGSSTIGVDSTGYGTGTYNLPSGLPANSSPNEAAVCVSDKNTNPSTYANAARLVVL
jgi:hypothetical protein